MFGVLWALGSPEAYALWWAGHIFFLPAFMRIRVIGEHGGVPDHFDPDPRNNTRTTLAGPLARLLVCPNFVNYHCEHHVAPEVPGHALPKLHALLDARDFYEHHPRAKERGYLAVLARCIGTGGRPGAFRKGEASFANMS